MRRMTMMVAVVLLGVATASAGIWENFYQGVQYAATPIGGPLNFAADGTRINGARSGRVRIVPNMLGDGHRLEIDRTFGVDSRGRPEVYDLGPYELELSGATQATLAYEKRGLFNATAEFFGNNIAYRSSFQTGAADAELTGTLSYANTFQINQLGFYTMQINITNDGSELTLSTLADEKTEELDFDIGPITVEGNIFLDLFVQVLGAMGVDTSGLARLSPNSPADTIASAFSDAINRQALVAGLSVSAEDASVVLGTPMSPVASLIAAQTPIVSAEQSKDDAQRDLVTPEPATLALLLLGAVTLWRRR